MNRSAKQLCAVRHPRYEMFLEVLAEADQACPIRLLEHRVMPNHWHLLVWPERDDQLSRYMRWITGVHGQRWRQAQRTVGWAWCCLSGPLSMVGVQGENTSDIA